MPPPRPPSFFTKPLVKETLCPHRTSKNNVSLFSKLPPPAPEPDVPAANQPLAERMRPRTLDEFIGQEKLLGPGKSLRVQIENDNLGSMLFWGPPGCGKTTLARLIARLTSSEFVSFSAVLAGIKEIKEVMAVAEQKSRSGHRTIVFVDEVHRFNKAQQDAFLPHVEAGHIIFIGATTENPSFEVISPLLSRTKVYVLDPLTTPQIAELPRRAAQRERRARHYARTPRRRAAAKTSPLRQSRRGALQPHFRPAQVRAQFRSRRRPILARAHDRIRRRP